MMKYSTVGLLWRHHSPVHQFLHLTVYNNCAEGCKERLPREMKPPPAEEIVTVNENYATWHSCLINYYEETKRTNGAPPQKSSIHEQTLETFHIIGPEWVLMSECVYSWIQSSLTMSLPINFIHPFIRSFNHFINEKQLNDESDMNNIHFSLSDQILVAVVTVVWCGRCHGSKNTVAIYDVPNCLSVFCRAMWRKTWHWIVISSELFSRGKHSECWPVKATGGTAIVSIHLLMTRIGIASFMLII